MPARGRSLARGETESDAAATGKASSFQRVFRFDLGCCDLSYSHRGFSPVITSHVENSEPS